MGYKCIHYFWREEINSNVKKACVLYLEIAQKYVFKVRGGQQVVSKNKIKE